MVKSDAPTDLPQSENDKSKDSTTETPTTKKTIQPLNQTEAPKETEETKPSEAETADAAEEKKPTDAAPVEDESAKKQQDAIVDAVIDQAKKPDPNQEAPDEAEQRQQAINKLVLTAT